MTRGAWQPALPVSVLGMRTSSSTAAVVGWCWCWCRGLPCLSGRGCSCYSPPCRIEAGKHLPVLLQTGALFTAVKQPTILLPTAFIFMWQATPSASSAMFYFTTNQLGFDAAFLGQVGFLTSLASLVSASLLPDFRLRIGGGGGGAGMNWKGGGGYPPPPGRPAYAQPLSP